MGKLIKQLYKDKGVSDKTPKGRGIHSLKFHQCVSSVLRDNKGYSYSRAASICMAQLGADKAVNPSHRRSE